MLLSQEVKHKKKSEKQVLFALCTSDSAFAINIPTFVVLALFCIFSQSAFT